MVSLTKEVTPNNNGKGNELEPVGISDEEFAELTVPEKRAVFVRLAARVLINTDDAEDVVQEAYIRAYSSRDKFKGLSAVTTWMHRITLNTAISSRMNQMRQTKPLVHLSTLADTKPEFEIEDSQPKVEEEVVAGEFLTEIKQKIEQLSKATRSVIELAMQGMSHEEISQELSISVSAAKVRLMRARNRLKELMAD